MTLYRTAEEPPNSGPQPPVLQYESLLFVAADDAPGGQDLFAIARFRGHEASAKGRGVPGTGIRDYWKWEWTIRKGPH